MDKLPKYLYIHIPFCDHICLYCDFYKMIAKDEIKEKYINYLIKELELKKDLIPKDLKTIYIGGGTPSNLDLNLLDKLFNALSKYIALDKLEEFSIECNPKDINIDLINLLNKYHVNRISLGVQSFNNEKLLFLRRNHTKDIAINAIKLLQENGINNINLDFIFGLSTDNIDLIKNDLDIAISLNVKHISFYTLIIEDKTILNKFIKAGYKPLSDDVEADIYDYINKYLSNFGYKHYEISNYAIPGYESIHNLCYWNNYNYLGLGANASYYIDNIRYTNINNLEKYFKGIDNKNLEYLEEIKLDIDDMMYEEVMLGLRKLDGVNKLNFINKYKCDIIEIYPKILDLIKQGILIDDGEYIKVNEDKIYILNDILLNILD